MTPSEAFGHAGNCIAANINILNLFTARVPYNICRNLEWQAQPQSVEPTSSNVSSYYTQK